MLPSQGNLADEQRGINGNVGVGLYPQASVSGGGDGELPAPIQESQPREQSQQRLLLLARAMKLKRCFTIHHQVCQFSTLNGCELKPFSAAFPVIGF